MMYRKKNSREDTLIWNYQWTIWTSWQEAMLALFMLTVIVTLFALSHRIRLLSNEIYKIEKQVSDYIDELSRSESDKLEIEHKAHQNGVISSVLQEIFP